MVRSQTFKRALLRGQLLLVISYGIQGKMREHAPVILAVRRPRHGDPEFEAKLDSKIKAGNNNNQTSSRNEVKCKGHYLRAGKRSFKHGQG